MKSLIKLLSLVALLLIISNVSCESNNKSREIYNLDPPEHKKGETYGEVTRFNQIYFTSEANFGSCNSICEDYAKPRDNFKEEFKYEQRLCKGTIHGCRYESQIGLYVYIPKNDKNKRYNHVVEPELYPLSLKEKYGKSTLKKSSDRKVFRSWPRGFVHCDVCRCLCDEPNDVDSVRKFLLRDLTSDVDQNMVVTGLQLILKDKIFSLRIYQAPLLPLGKVDGSKTTFKTAYPNHKDDKYFKLEYNQNSSFVGPAQISERDAPDFVVTGVKFIVKDGHLALEATFTKFDISTGKLIQGSTKSIINDKSNKYLNRPFHGFTPTTHKDNRPFEENKEGLVEFKSSSIFEDVGQSTVPFLDLKPVKSSETALSGVGLMFRTREKIPETSGGFIAPKLITYP